MGQFDISKDRAINYHADIEQTRLNYEVLSEAISQVRCAASLCVDWEARIEQG